MLKILLVIHSVLRNEPCNKLLLTASGIMLRQISKEFLKLLHRILHTEIEVVTLKLLLLLILLVLELVGLGGLLRELDVDQQVGQLFGGLERGGGGVVEQRETLGF